jgi:hypothetical protein
MPSAKSKTGSPAGPTFARQPQVPDEVAEHHRSATEALRYYYLAEHPAPPPSLVGRSREELAAELSLRLGELDHWCSLALLAAVEAALRDVYDRRRKRPTKPIARALRGLRKRQAKGQPRLDDLLACWLEGPDDCREAIGRYRGCLKYRHWLAHGRSWGAHAEFAYRFQDVYEITAAVFGCLPPNA